MLIVPTLHPAFVLRSNDSDRDDARFSHVIVADLKKAWTLRKRKPLWDESEIFKRRADGAWPAIFPTLEDVRAFVNDTIGTKVAVDVETTGNTPVDCRLICIGFASENGRVLCFPILRQGGAKYWDPVEWPDALEAITYLLEDKDTPKVFHNGPFDLTVLHCFGINVFPWGDDTLFGHHCVDAEMPHKLAFLASMRLETRYWKDEVKGDIAWLNLPDERLRVYNLRDCLTTIRVLPSILEEIKRWGVEALYREEIEIAKIMLESTIEGVEVDMWERWRLSFEFERRYAEAYADLVTLTGDPEFTLSGPRVAKFLYETLGFPIGRRTETINPFTGLGSPSTDKKALSLCALQVTPSRADMSSLEKQPATFTAPSSYLQERGLIALARARKFDKLLGTYVGEIRPAPEVWSNALWLALLMDGRNYDPEIYGVTPELPALGEQTISTEGKRQGLRTLFHEEDGTYRIHTTWSPTTLTGRFRSSPNLQNLKDTIKGILKAREGYRFVAVDLSRAELRAIGYFAEDHELLRMFEEDLNLHTINVALMVGIRSPGLDTDPQTEAYLQEACKRLSGKEYGTLPIMGDGIPACATCAARGIAASECPERLKEISDRWEMTRRLMKEIVFGSNYKGTAVTLYETMKAKRDPRTDQVLFPDVELRHVEANQRQWINLHPAIERYWEKIVRLAKSQGYLRCPLSGRIKRFRAGVKESEAINWPIQTFVASWMNKCLRTIHAKLCEEAPTARTRLQIHDALYVEALLEDIPTVKKVYKVLDAPMRLEPFPGVVFEGAILPGDKPKVGTHLDDRLKK